jgi:carboxyl-terminal processing protease
MQQLSVATNNDLRMAISMNEPRIGYTRNRFSLAALLLAVGAGVLLDRTAGPQRSPNGLGREFGEAWRLVDQSYVDRRALVPQQMTQGAIRGLLDSLGDTGHTGYLTRQQFQELESSLRGELEGIGARFTVRKGDFTIVQTFPESPARRAGLLPGDVLLQVDRKKVQDLSIQKVVESIRGPADTTVLLRVRRKGRAGPLDFTIRRQKVTFPEVAWQLLPGEAIAHFAILEFGVQADSEFRKALGEARHQGAKALILDLRGNPGGLKDQAVAIASEFLKEGNVFLEKDARGNQTAVPVRAGGEATEIPLCVVIDNGTASSAEIVAGAIQDHHRGKLVGTRTFGTGTVLKPFPLSDGSIVLLAVVEWLTPNGRQIWHKGIAPDVDVALPEDGVMVILGAGDELNPAALAGDPQLLKAVELLTGKSGNGARPDRATPTTPP